MGHITKNQEQRFHLSFGRRGGAARAEAPGNKIPGFGINKAGIFLSVAFVVRL